MQAGRDHEWAKPYNPNPDPHEPHGSHIGPYSCLNIRNPRPGYHAAYAHRDDPGGFHNMQMMGFRPVTAEGGTRLASEVPMQFGAPQDDLIGMGKLVLMEIPLDQYAEVLAREAAQRELALKGPTQSFLDKGAGFNREYGRKPARVGAVYALPEHGENGYRTSDHGEDY